MNGELGDQTTKERAWSLCKEFLTGPWMTVSLEDFEFVEVSGGFSNTLHRCSLPEKARVDSRTPKEVLLRTYGPIQDDPAVVVTETVTFMLLSERNLGPKLYGVFPKGRLEEFIPSRSLGSDDLRRYSASIAREMAKIHALDVPVRKDPNVLLASVRKWLDEVQGVLQKDNGKHFMSYNEFRKEMDWLEQEMKQSDSPVVYCHNDLQGGNILYREDVTQNANPKLMLIDFEFGQYNYRGFDFANHFVEWCFDYNTPEYPHFKFEFVKFPAKQEQIEYLTAYTDQLLNEGVQLNRSPEEEVESMLNEIAIFNSASNLFWGIWSAKMLLTIDSEFHKITNIKNCEEVQNDKTNTLADISLTTQPSGEVTENGISSAVKEHGKTRIKLYRTFKEQYLLSK